MVMRVVRRTAPSCLKIECARLRPPHHTKIAASDGVAHDSLGGDDKPANCACVRKRIASVAAKVASLKGDLVRGAWVLVTPARPATSGTYSTVSGFATRFLSVLLGFVLL